MSDDTAHASPAPPPVRVLVIEASPTLRLMMASLLRRWGFAVDDGTPASAGATPQATYGLVVAAPFTGVPALDELRQSTRAAGVPWLAVLPANGDGMAADADGWVQKPIVPDALHDAVRLCLDRRSRTRRLDGLDLGAIASLWGSAGNATFRRVAVVFIGEMAERLSSIAGAAGQDAPGALDRETLVIEAHSIGSAAANVGCAALSRIARSLEHEAAAGEPARVQALVGELRSCAARDLAALQALVAGG